MCRALHLVAAMTVLSSVAAQSGEPPSAYTPEQIIEKAIDYHDPNGMWDQGRITLEVHTAYSEEFAKKRGSKDAKLTIVLSPGHEVFSYTKEAGGDKIEIKLEHGEGSIAVNGTTEVSDEDKERLRLAEPALYRDYCEYLYGMPMKLRDPGTIVDPHVNNVSFNSKDAWALKVTYDPEVGEHTWYFYFDPVTFALIGYKFYKDESKNDGEYITFEDEIVDDSSGLRLPKIRAWYYNANDGHLATDDIASMRTSS